jgi:hypothetical protein
MLRDQHRADFDRDGFVVVPLFSADECEALISHFMELRKAEWPGDFAGVDLTSDDPLKKYPRLIHMHHWDKASFKWAIDRRLDDALTQLLGLSPYMVPTMLYFKPPGARGQALHQDQSYLRAQPGTCVAAWLALDDTDEENGCMQLVPGSQGLPLLCTVKADTTQSFTDVMVPVPDGMEIRPAVMNRGDVLFFNGQVIHGSYPNRSKDRFRRSLIAHYITGDAEKVHFWYHPIFRMDGTEIKLGLSEGGSQCGVWVDRDGHPEIEMITPTEVVEVGHE